MQIYKHLAKGPLPKLLSQLTSKLNLEAQIVKPADTWAYISDLISTKLITIGKPTLLDNIIKNFNKTKGQFLGYLKKLYAKNNIIHK